MLRKTKEYYNDSLRMNYGDPIGASLSEISDIESTIKNRLPISLKEYLSWGGKHGNGPLIGTDCFISDIIDNTEYLPEFLKLNGLTNPKGDAYIVFYSHQGYVLAWIYLDGSENPEVYYFAEGTTEKIETVISIDEWFYQDLAGLYNGENC